MHKEFKIEPLLTALMIVTLIVAIPAAASFSYNNIVYAQEVDLGPLVVIDEDDSQHLSTESLGTDTYVVYEEDCEIFLAKLLDDGESLEDESAQISGDIECATDPDVATGSVAVVFDGGTDIFSVECDDNDDSCDDPINVSSPSADEDVEGEGNPNSCADGSDNDGDELTDAADPDCFASSEFIPTSIVSSGLCSDGLDNDGDELIDYGVPDVAGPDPDCFIPNESDQPTSCFDGVDNDGDGDIDGDDSDCFEASLASNDNPEFQSVSFSTSASSSINSEAKLTFVTTATGPSNPQVALSDSGKMYVVWEEGGDIFFNSKEADEANFDEANEINLSDNSGTSTEPKIDVSGDFVHVIWKDNTPGNYEIFYSRSTNEGVTFNGGSAVPGEDHAGPPTNLSNSNRNSQNHELEAEGSNVYVAWEDRSLGNGDIFFRRSSNNGATFFGRQNLSNNTGASENPDLAAIGSKVAVIWEDKTGAVGGKADDVLFKFSSNSGQTFGAIINVSKNGGDSDDPKVDFTPDGEIYVVWLDKSPVPAREHQPNGIFAVFAKESENGKTFSSPAIILSDDEDNPKADQNASLLELDEDVATWDPVSRRG